MPAERERAEIEDEEDVGEQFGKTREEAEGQRESWRGVRFEE